MEGADNERISLRLAKVRESLMSSEKQLWSKLKTLMMFLFGKRLRAQTLVELETQKLEHMDKFNR
jgi:hypothetical protein